MNNCGEFEDMDTETLMGMKMLNEMKSLNKRLHNIRDKLVDNVSKELESSNINKQLFDKVIEVSKLEELVKTLKEKNKKLETKVSKLTEKIVNMAKVISTTYK